MNNPFFSLKIFRMTGLFVCFSFSILKMYLHYLLACIVFENKSTAIHLLVPLDIVCLFTLAIFFCVLGFKNFDNDNDNEMI